MDDESSCVYDPPNPRGIDDNVLFVDFGAMKQPIEELRKLTLKLNARRNIYRILLHGVQGCGKTKLVEAWANESELPIYSVSATDLVNRDPAPEEPLKYLRDLFSKAYDSSPSIVFIDDIHAIASESEDLLNETERWIAMQLRSSMYDTAKPVAAVVIAATNSTDAVAQIMKWPKTFNQQIVIPVPDEHGRNEILCKLTFHLRLEDGFDYSKIAALTRGFVGADLKKLVHTACDIALQDEGLDPCITVAHFEIVRIVVSRTSPRTFLLEAGHGLEDVRRLRADLKQLVHTACKIAIQDKGKMHPCINVVHFEDAVKNVEPYSVKNEILTIPKVKWEDVRGLDSVKKKLNFYVIESVKSPKLFKDFSGGFICNSFLLYGPPGCGKTLLVGAVASEGRINFMHIKGAEFLYKYAGDPEMAVQSMFSHARTWSPCILFFDQLEKLLPECDEEERGIEARFLRQLAVELENLKESKAAVYVIAATHRPDRIDLRLTRQMGKRLYVPLPTSEERCLILEALSQKMSFVIEDAVKLLGKDDATKGLSGADLRDAIQEAAIVALEESSVGVQCTVKESHFRIALMKIRPSVSVEQVQVCERFHLKSS